MATSLEEAHRGRRPGRLPGHRAAQLRHRRPGHRLLLRAGGPGAPAGRARPSVDDGPAGAHRRLPRGPRGRRRRRLRRHATCSSRGSWSTSSGPASTPATRSAVFPPQRLSTADQGLIVDAMTPGRAGDRRARPHQRPVHRPRRRRLPAGGQPARQPHGALPVQGHRRADGRAGDPGRAGRHARRAGLGRRAASRRRAVVAVKAPVFSTSQAARRRSRRWARACSRRARSSASTDDPRVAHGQGAPGGLAAAAGAGPGRRAGAGLDRRPRQGAPGRAGRGAGGVGYRFAATAGTAAPCGRWATR